MKGQAFQLKRFLIEATTIVLSILLAFWIDASWSGHVDRQQTEKSLVALLSDFESYFDEIDEKLETHNRRTRSSTILAMASERELNAIPLDSMVTLLWGSLYPGTLDLQTVGVSSMIATNQISKIRSASLRRKLAEWDAHYRDYKGSEADLVDYLNDSFFPYVNTRIVIPWGPDDIVARSHASLRPMFSDMSFQNHAILVRVQSLVCESELGAVRNLTQEIIELLKDELGPSA